MGLKLMTVIGNFVWLGDDMLPFDMLNVGTWQYADIFYHMVKEI